jgi:glycosyltransferase involved in cell wall biosynthesis
MKKSVLWFCNRLFSEKPDQSTGTWLSTMGQALVASEKIRLSNISQAKVREVVRQDWDHIRQWAVPFEPLGRDGLPSKQTIKAIQGLIDEIKPDLIHVWGTENYWGLLSAREIIPGPTILDMQGIKFAYAKVFYGGLAFSELIHCIGPKEFLLPSCSLFAGKRQFEHWGRYEIEMIQKHKYISTQSEWVRAHILRLNPGCTLFSTGIILRRAFTDAEAWTESAFRDSAGPTIFTSSSGAIAYKGLHVLLRAIATLKSAYPQIVLKIAGDQLRKGIRRSGYARWLQREARRLGIENNIRWLGPLDAEGIIREFYQASAVVIPSFAETYCIALAEAMLIGVPAVVSYAGAMPELARDEESALFFPPGDEIACARQLDRILRSCELASRLSQNARRISLLRSDSDAIVNQQIKIYDTVFGREELS